MAVPVIRPLLGEEEIRAVEQVLRSGWVTQGPEVAAFESEFARYVGAGFACAVSSCTAALHLALLAVGVRPGDEVITASHSFIATANSIRYCGATPVFVDIEPGTFNIDATLVERVLTERTRALLCVHQMGMPCHLEKLLEIASAHGLPLIEDAACSVGSELLEDGSWQRIGKPHGAIACFSFHPRKLLTTGEGGMITTSDAQWDSRLRSWRQHSMSAPARQRHDSQEVIFESYPELGFNYRMTDIQAAIGRVQLRRLPGVIQRRREGAARYRELLSRIPGLGLPAEPEWARSNWQSFCVRLPDGCNQRQVMQRMLNRGISVRRGIMCCHREPAYRVEPWECGGRAGGCGCVGGRCRRLEESERAHDSSVILPLFDQLSDAEQDRVVSALDEACASSSRSSG